MCFLRITCTCVFAVGYCAWLLQSREGSRHCNLYLKTAVDPDIYRVPEGLLKGSFMVSIRV